MKLREAKKGVLPVLLALCAVAVVATPTMAGYDILNGTMSTFQTSGVATDWTSYSYRSDGTNPRWASAAGDSADPTSGTAQRIYVSTTGSGAYAGIRQTIDAFVGDAVTVTARAGGAENNSTYAYLGADWAGGTAPPAIANMILITGKTWNTAIKSITGNATGSGVTVFLHAPRQTQAAKSTQYINFDTVNTYHAYRPDALTAGAVTASSLSFGLDTGLNNAGAQYAISIAGGSLGASSWLAGGGALGVAETWLTGGDWMQDANKVVSGLSAGETYTLQVKARYNDTYRQETTLSDALLATTATAAVPEAGSILAALSILGPATLAFRRRAA